MGRARPVAAGHARPDFSALLCRYGKRAEHARPLHAIINTRVGVGPRGKEPVELQACGSGIGILAFIGFRLQRAIVWRRQMLNRWMIPVLFPLFAGSIFPQPLSRYVKSSDGEAL